MPDPAWIDLPPTRLSDLPGLPGLFSLKQAGEPLWTWFVPDLKTGLTHFRQQAGSVKGLPEAWDRCDSVSYAVTPDLWSALVAWKLATRNRPTAGVRPESRYVYLEVNPEVHPFVAISEFTLGTGLYIGPFRDRYFLSDSLLTLNRLFGSPACEGEDYPCELYKEGFCRGFCLSDPGDIGFLPGEVILTDGEGLLMELRHKYETLMNNLLFADAELLGRQIRLLENYFAHLAFFAITKNLDGHIRSDYAFIEVKHGRIAAIEVEGRTLSFDTTPTEARENETLAFDKAEYDERYLVFRKMLESDPALIANSVGKTLHTTMASKREK